MKKLLEIDCLTSSSEAGDGKEWHLNPVTVGLWKFPERPFRWEIPDDENNRAIQFCGGRYSEVVSQLWLSKVDFIRVFLSDYIGLLVHKIAQGMKNLEMCHQINSGMLVLKLRF